MCKRHWLEIWWTMPRGTLKVWRRSATTAGSIKDSLNILTRNSRSMSLHTFKRIASLLPSINPQISPNLNQESKQETCKTLVLPPPSSSSIRATSSPQITSRDQQALPCCSRRISLRCNPSPQLLSTHHPRTSQTT